MMSESLANGTDSDEVFSIGERSFRYILESNGLRIDFWRIPCFPPV